jgi:hypothetical protein
MRLTSNSPPKSLLKKYPTFLLCTLFLLTGVFMGLKNIPGTIKANFLLLTNTEIWSALTETNKLDTIHLDVSFKNIQKIENKRKNALKNNRLVSSSDDFVKAKLTHNGNIHPAKIRLKGDLPDHWSNEKISLRIKLIDSCIYGLPRFSLQRHGTRQDTGQWLFLNCLKKEGCLAVDYDFINFFLNGKDFGIYALEGHFGRDIFEKNKRREGVIVAFDENRFWEDNTKLSKQQLGIKLLKYSNIINRNQSSVEKSEFLTSQSIIARKLLNEFINNNANAADIFDTDILGKFLALCRVWNAEHALYIHNISFYLNPITLKLEPIGYDGMPGFSEKPSLCFFQNPAPELLWVRKALSSSIVAQKYSKYLLEYSSSSFFNNLEKTFREEESYYRNLIVKNLLFEDRSTIWSSFFTLYTKDLWNILKTRLNEIREEYKVNKPLSLSASAYKGGFILKIKNCTSKPIKLLNLAFDQSKGLKIEEAIQDPDTFPTVVPPAQYLENEKTSKHFIIPNKHYFKDHTKPLPKSCTLSATYLGNDEIFEIEALIEPFEASVGQVIPSSNTNWATFDFFEKEGKVLRIPQGNYDILKSIYIDHGYTLQIDQGTTLRFANEAFIYTNSPLSVMGTKVNPIRFTSKNQFWPGIVINSASTSSSFVNVEFMNMKGIGTANNIYGMSFSGWNLTGGLTIYQSPVHFNNCSFLNCYSEDALNVISTEFTLENCNFKGIISDAFDGDFVNGEIRNCEFNDIGGDGVDFSGSTAGVRKSSFKNITDKAISVGEGSNVDVSACKIKSVSFGVVSKDLSVTKAYNNTISYAKTAAFAAFQKKNSFGPASIIVSHPKITECKQLFLVQNGSVGRLDDQIVQTSDFKSSHLY